MADLQNPKLFQTSQRRKLMGRIILVVLVFISCWTGPTIHRGYELIEGKTIDRNNGGAFWFLDVASLSVSGFINALVWYTNPDCISSFFLFFFIYPLPLLSLLFLSFNFPRQK